jgi:hypothetical protein
VKRDRELVSWIARLGTVEVRHIQECFAGSRSVAYDLMARCQRARLLEHLSLIHGEPALIRATRDGIAFAGALTCSGRWPVTWSSDGCSLVARSSVSSPTAAAPP